MKAGKLHSLLKHWYSIFNNGGNKTKASFGHKLKQNYFIYLLLQFLWRWWRRGLLLLLIPIVSFNANMQYKLIDNIFSISDYRKCVYEFLGSILFLPPSTMIKLKFYLDSYNLYSLVLSCNRFHLRRSLRNYTNIHNILERSHSFHHCDCMRR